MNTSNTPCAESLATAAPNALARLRRPNDPVREILELRAELAWLGEEVVALRAERDRLRQELVAARYPYVVGDAPQFVPPGHHYSPIPALQEVRAHEQRIFGVRSFSLPAIDLREAAQLELLEHFARYYDEVRFPAHKTPERRYHHLNGTYPYGDAMVLHSMIRDAQPARIVEVGSGYSSCVTLDTNEEFLANRIGCTFIDPYPELLQSLIRPDDFERVEILPLPLQEVPVAVFRTLQPRDILFIDSTHVSKVGSDVNYLVFEILPALAPGVLIHIHDIFYPFEYPRAWILEGRQWTEAYVLRAFLEYNRHFEVVYWNSFLERCHPQRARAAMPLCSEHRGGSIWLRKVSM